MTVPPGQCTLMLTNSSGVTVYVGGAGVTTGNGCPIPAGALPVAVPGYPSSASSVLYVVAGAGTVTGPVGWLLSTGT